MPRLPSAADFGVSGPRPSRGITEITPVREQADLSTGKVLFGLADMMAKEAERLDDVVAEDAYNKLREKRIEMSVGEKGFSAVRGGDVISKKPLETFPMQFDKEIEAISGGIGGAKARAKFQQRANAEKNGYRLDLIRHVTGETDKYAEVTAKSRIETESSIAAGAYDDPAKYAEAIGNIDRVVASEAARLGLSGDALNSYRRETLGYAHGVVLDRLISGGKADAAVKYFKSNRDSMSPKQQSAYTAKVKTAEDDMLGINIGTEAASQPVGKQLDFIREKTEGRPGAYAQAVQVLGQRRTEQRLADEDAIGTFSLQMESAPTARTLQKIMADPGFAAVSDTAKSRFIRDANRYMRVLTNEARADKREADLARREEYANDPEVQEHYARLREMDVVLPDSTINSLRLFLGPDYTKQLIQDNEAKRKGVYGFVLKEADITAALPTSLQSPKTPTDKARVDVFRNMAQDELVRWKQANPNRKPDRDELNGILRAGMREATMMGGWLGTTAVSVPGYQARQAVEAAKEQGEVPPIVANVSPLVYSSELARRPKGMGERDFAELLNLNAEAFRKAKNRDATPLEMQNMMRRSFTVDWPRIQEARKRKPNETE